MFKKNKLNITKYNWNKTLISKKSKSEESTIILNLNLVTNKFYLRFLKWMRPLKGDFFHKMGFPKVRPEGLEPSTSWSVARHSIQLSYGRMLKALRIILYAYIKDNFRLNN